MIGYPLGNGLSLNQGTLIRRWTAKGAPMMEVRMLGAEGASGAPYTDDAGRVLGIVQVGLGSKDIFGQHTGGVQYGLDLVRWWGPQARLDLCRAYPNGGIAGCANPKPKPPPRPVRPAPALAEIWTSLENSSDPAKKIGHVGDFAPSVHVYTIIRFNEALTPSDARALSLSVVEPDGTTYESRQFTLDPGHGSYSIPSDVHGSGGHAPMGGTWVFRVEYGAQTLTTGLGFSNFGPFAVSIAPSDTFDPHFARIEVSWRLIQDVPLANNYTAELLSPSGRLLASQVLTTALASQGVASLTTSCSDASAAPCEYGEWRVRIRLGSNLIWGTTLDAVSPS
jgi:hypothetical protein